MCGLEIYEIIWKIKELLAWDPRVLRVVSKKITWILIAVLFSYFVKEKQVGVVRMVWPKEQAIRGRRKLFLISQLQLNMQSDPVASSLSPCNSNRTISKCFAKSDQYFFFQVCFVRLMI